MTSGDEYNFLKYNKDRQHTVQNATQALAFFDQADIIG